MVSTDHHGGPAAPSCGHCGTPFEPGRITCASCGEARLLEGAPAGAPGDGAVRRGQGRPVQAGPDDPDGDQDLFDIGDPFRDVVRRRPRGPAQRSRTTLLIGGVIGLILVALVAAAALWALGQHGGGAGF